MAKARPLLAQLPKISASIEEVTMEPKEKLHPGDEAEPGTVGAGEGLCDNCSGTGKLENGQPCPECDGTGRVMRGIGGG